MSKTCEVTGKRYMKGNNVSHANNKTTRRYYPNLQVKRFFDPETNKWVTLKVSAAGIRRINKVGISAILKEMKAAKKAKA